MMVKILKNVLILTLVLLIGIFIGKKTNTNKIIEITNEIKNISHVDTSYSNLANRELYNYISNYYDVSDRKLPEFYVNINGDTIHYNKENFYYYYSLYEINRYLSEGKSKIINNLLEEKDTIY